MCPRCSWVQPPRGESAPRGPFSAFIKLGFRVYDYELIVPPLCPPVRVHGRTGGGPSSVSRHWAVAGCGTPPASGCAGWVMDTRSASADDGHLRPPPELMKAITIRQQMSRFFVKYRCLANHTVLHPSFTLHALFLHRAWEMCQIPRPKCPPHFAMGLWRE